ncbi:recombinase family protein [Poseidonocella pacifica]|uniref:recombinase family protein n=1 Tax=Poseidonocella pacifica TaxID=871651 RepID=UPI000B872A4C|nr:recombinase family protein [Poseidonocella pacifica]
MTTQTTPTSPPKAVIYARSAIRNDAAIADQRAKCTAYAVAKGYSIEGIFNDNGVTGVGEDRPGLRGLLWRLRERQATIVIATEPSRLFRDAQMLAGFKASCAALGADISYACRTGSVEDLMPRPSEKNIAKRQRRSDRGTTV